MLTAIILVKDGAQTLEATLQSLLWCGEIIVADDASSDDSVEIAARYDATIMHQKPTSSYAAKRNQALKHVHTPWVLFVDCDEVVTKDLRNAIEKAMKEKDTQGWYIKRNDWFMGKRLLYGETAHMWLLRLARVNAGRWKRDVHEVWDISGKTRRLDGGVLEHHPHPTLTSFFAKLNRYSTLEAAARATHKQLTISRVFMELLSFPVGKFLQHVILFQGIRDGYAGVIHAYWMALYSLMLRIKMLECIREKKKKS